ncbi:MAG TPA: EAL domain-containing protein [Candidatus Binatia bacterium]|nr:EAL domain-containing protein [Candidatus Binatia bacterium]
MTRNQAAGGHPVKPWAVVALALLVTFCAGGIYVGLRPALLERLEAEMSDLRFRIRGVEQPDPRTVIVAADEKSAAELGHWPFSHRYFAVAIDRLKADGAKVIAFDVLFPQAEPAMSPEIRDKLAALKSTMPPGSEAAQQVQAVMDAPGPDDAMAAAMKSAGNVVLGFSLDFGDAEVKGTTAPDYFAFWSYGNVPKRLDGTPPGLPQQALGILPPVDVLGRAAAGAGYVNVNPDIDFAARSEIMALQLGPDYYPPLSVVATGLYLGKTPDQFTFQLGSTSRPGWVEVGDRRVPINGDALSVVNYYGPQRTFPTYSIADVVAGRFTPGTFKDKIVFVGATLTAVHDLFKSPFDPVLPGVERHATIADRILDGPLLLQPDYARAIDLAAVILLGLTTAFFTMRLPASGAIPGTVVTVALWWAVGQFALFPYGIVLNFVYPTVSVLANFIAITAFRIVREERQRRAAERSLRVSEERYALAARGANDGLWDWDLATGRFYTSPRWHQMLGIAAEETAGKPEDWFDRTHREDVTTLRAAIDTHLAGHSAHFEQEFRMRHRDETDRWMQARGLAVVDRMGKPYRFAGSMTDITDRKLAERQLLFDAFHSRLTGLPNRALLIDRINQATQLWQRGGESDVVVLILDLDHFRHINETLGQAVGDQILISLARNLEPALRSDDTLAHLGEDEFAVLRFAAGDVRGQTEQLLGAIYGALSKPIAHETREFEIKASIGYVLASQSAGETGDEMLRDANLALYKAKTTGRGQATQFEAAMHATAVKRFDLEADLRRAVAKGGELELFYQPIIDIQNDRIHGYEALLRWRHPTRGLVSPIDFIPLAEDTGLIVEIGRRSILEAAKQIAAWTPASGKPPQVAVNVSGRQFAAEGLLDDIETALKMTGIPAECLKLEVTESLVMDNPERTVELLRRILARGCKVSIDDFGTGYSSLSHLHRFPFNTLKIDRSFIIRMTESREGFEIVRVIASMAKVLERDVVAEGVEDQAQVEILRDLGVEFIQGYVYSKPLPAAEASAFLDGWRQRERDRGSQSGTVSRLTPKRNATPTP